MTAIRIEKPLRRVLLWGFVAAGLHGVATLVLFHLSGHRYGSSGTALRFFGTAAAEVQRLLHAPLFLSGLDDTRPWPLRFALFATGSVAYGYGAAALTGFVLEQFKNRRTA